MFATVDLTRRGFLSTSAGAAIGAMLSGCGTVMYPERRGQRAGRLDWKVVALDTVGLMVFFVPGVVAFAVDFSNGTIYLPDEGYANASDRQDRGELRAIAVAPDELDQRRIEREVSSHVGQEIDLTSADVRAGSLSEIDEFWSAADEMAADRPAAEER